MDPDLRELLKEHRAILTRMDMRLESALTSMNAHINDSIEKRTATSIKLEAAHRRLDEHREEHKESRRWMLGLVAGVILMWVKALWDLLRKGP